MKPRRLDGRQVRPAGAIDTKRKKGRDAAEGEAMARPKKHGAGLSKPVSFRLSEPDFLAYQEKVRASGLSASDFFRDAVLTNRTQIVARPKATADKHRALYLLNKAGNNINQLAHRANAAHQAGKLSEKTLEGILDNLELITRYLKATVGHVD